MFHVGHKSFESGSLCRCSRRRQQKDTSSICKGTWIIQSSVHNNRQVSRLGFDEHPLRRYGLMDPTTGLQRASGAGPKMSLNTAVKATVVASEADVIYNACRVYYKERH